MSKLFILVFAFLPAGRQVLLHQRQIRNIVAPGHPTSLRYVGQSTHLQALKILHFDKYLAPRQFVPRHCDSARH
jgi:hypothetical protein